MNKNIWDNYFQFMNPETKSTAEINSWLQSSMDYMDDFMTFSKKVCEMKATPDDIMLLWENASKKIQGSVSECMKMFGVADNSETEEAIKKYETAGKTIDDQKKKIKDQEKEISAQKKEIEKLNQSLSEQKKEVNKLVQSLADQKKDADKLSQSLADHKKEITKLQQTISSLETTAVKAATPNTNQ